MVQNARCWAATVEVARPIKIRQMQMTVLRIRTPLTLRIGDHEQNLLQSGWLIGEHYLSNKPAIIDFQVEEGKVVIIAFPAQHRAQTHATFKFFFKGFYFFQFTFVNRNDIIIRT